MTRFIKLPKSLTDDTSFDLLNLNGFGELYKLEWQAEGSNRLKCNYLGSSCESDDLTQMQITLDGVLTSAEENTLINNTWEAIKLACQNPGSIPTLEIPGGRVVSSIFLQQPL
tara:strand:- start:189 stop:527 length:339 start_codon:yes stop_codon:yes gene_type:complete